MDPKSTNLSEQIEKIRDAFYAANQRPQAVVEDPWVVDVFDDHVVIREGEFFWEVSYTMGDDGVEFAARDTWEKVEQEYVPAKVSDMLIAWGGAVKALGEGRVGGLGVRFTGEGDTDLEGERFTAKTYYGAHDGDGADCWVHHGFPLVKGEQGKEWADHLLKPVKAERQDMGIWVEAVCDMADDYEQKVYEMAEAGKLGWSSATAGHMRRVTDDGEITRWPIVEFSLTPTPAEPRNRVMTLKAYKATMTEPLQADPPQGDVPKTPPATAATKAAKPPTKKKPKRKGGKTVAIKRFTFDATHYAYKVDEEGERVGPPLFASVKAEDVDKFISDGLKPDWQRVVETMREEAKLDREAMVKAYVAQTGAKEPGLYATGNAVVKSKHTFGDFIMAVGRKDRNMLKAMGSTFEEYEQTDGTKVLGDQSGAEGGFTVPTQFLAELIRIDPETEIVWPTARNIPMASRSIEIPGLDTTGSTAGRTNSLGGMFVQWTETGTTKHESEPAFTQIELVAHELSAYTEVKLALLQDSAISLDPLLKGLFRDALMFYSDEAFLDGTGAGQPQGIVTAPGTLVLARNTVLRIVYADITNMFMHFLSQARSGAFWVLNQMCMEELMTVQDPAGNYIWQPNAREGIPGTIFGLPVKWTEKTPTLGTQGDIILMNPKWYYIGSRQGVTIGTSDDFLFQQNRRAYRCVLRVDGQEALPAPIFLKDGANQVSPFVVLGAAAT